MKEFRNPQNVYPPTGYAHQVELGGNERLLIIAGQIGRAENGSIPSAPLEQLELVFENIERNLRAAGMDMKDLVKLNYYLVGEWDTDKRRELTAKKLGGHKPMSTLVYVAGLASPELKVEVEAWASRATE